MSDKKVIGILGGMGPLATADLFQKITLHTAASCDQDHPRVCIDSNTNISDRTAALLHGGADPVPEMVKSAQRLESIGADLLIMPCNTAHNFYDAVASSVSIPVLHMIAITRDALKSRGVKCAGLLATDGTVQTGIYQRTFEHLSFHAQNLVTWASITNLVQAPGYALQVFTIMVDENRTMLGTQIVIKLSFRTHDPLERTEPLQMCHAHIGNQSEIRIHNFSQSLNLPGVACPGFNDGNSMFRS